MEKAASPRTHLGTGESRHQTALPPTDTPRALWAVLSEGSWCRPAENVNVS